jgi:hypothetical protein
MRFRFLLTALIFLTSCETIAPARILDDDSKPVKLEIPATVYYSCQFWLYEKTEIRRATEYWNEVAGVKLFIPSEKCGIPDTGELISVNFIDKEKIDRDTGSYEVAETRAGDGNPVKDAEIFIFNRWRRLLSPQQQESVVRHELGHVLGMDHTPDGRCLMYWNTDYDDPDIVTPACNAEIKMIKGIYKSDGTR